MAVLHRASYKKRGGKDMSSVMDVEENFMPVNSREDIEKVMRNSGEKKKEKYFKKLFDFLGGGESPIEAVELALGRDTSLKETQLTVLSIFSLWVDELNCQTVAGDKERKVLLNFLSDCNIVKLVVRLIMLKAKQPDGKELCSKYLYYHCINILAHITNKRYIENGLERMKNVKVIRAYKAVPRLVEFLDPLNNDPLTIYQTSEVLKHLTNDITNIHVRIHKADGLRRCLHFMLRKEADKMFADFQKENFSSKLSMSNEDVEILEKFYSGRKYLIKNVERYPQVTGFDLSRECFIYMSAELQENCALIVFEIVSNPKIPKPEILTLKPFIKVLNKWFFTPCIWRPERTMLQGCFHILRGVLSDEKPHLPVKEFLKTYDVLPLIKLHIYNPDQEVVSSVISLLSELSMQYPSLRKMFMTSPLYSKLLPVYLQSYDNQVQVWALQCLISFVTNKAGAKHVLSIGVTAEKLYLLTEYNYPPTNGLIKTLKTEMEKYCKGEWQASEEAFQKVQIPQKYCLEVAQKYKEQGNSRFKNEEYESALKCYTLGLESTPPVDNFTLVMQPSFQDSSYKPWYVLPSVLFTNRAQCYLSLNKWQEAIDDCTQAIARSYENNDEAKKILFKTVYRRARAFSELKDYRSALNDVSFCLRFNPAATNVRSFFREILTAYRKEFGIESLRRCGTCMEGVGMKLKRCAKCPEMYCSRECQTHAWEEESHKQLCNYTLDDNNSE